MNIQQPTTLEVAYTETVMSYNEDLDPPPPQDILNVFSSADLSFQLSSDLDKYKRAWYKVIVTRYPILSSTESPDAYSRALSIALDYKEIASIMVVNGAIWPKLDMPMQLPNTNKRKKYFPMQHLSVIDKNK